MKIILQRKDRSADYAKSRMKLLLVSERINCSPQMMTMLKNDLIHTVKKYITVDEKHRYISTLPRTLRFSMRISLSGLKRNKRQND